MKKVVVRSSETTYQTTQRHISLDSLRSELCRNLELSEKFRELHDGELCDEYSSRIM
jgi:hypothetical protein